MVTNSKKETKRGYQPRGKPYIPTVNNKQQNFTPGEKVSPAPAPRTYAASRQVCGSWVRAWLLAAPNSITLLSPHRLVRVVGGRDVLRQERRPRARRRPVRRPRRAVFLHASRTERTCRGLMAAWQWLIKITSDVREAKNIPCGRGTRRPRACARSAPSWAACARRRRCSGGRRGAPG